VNRVLILEPSHFNNYPISENVLNFILDLANNIQGIQVFCGETHEIAAIYHQNEMDTNKFIISKEHPAFKHYPGIKDERTWMFPTVKGYYPSFFNYWKKCFSTLH
jgi:deoxyribodipyrimidine photo-lyase